MKDEIDKIYFTPCEVRKAHGIRTHYELKKLIQEWDIPHLRITPRTFRFHKNHLPALQKALDASKKVKEIQEDTKSRMSEAVLFRRTTNAKYTEKINNLQKEKSEIINDINEDIQRMQKEEIKAINKIVQAVRKVTTDSPV